MSPATMTAEPAAPPRPATGEPTVRDIIAKARIAQQPVPEQGQQLAGWAMAGLTGLLLWACFTPVNASSLAWVALVPVLLLVRVPHRTRRMYRGLYLAAAVSQLATLQWMRLGDPTMYIAWIALALYLAAYLPAFVWLTRVAVYRAGVPLVIAAPLLWVGLEFFRAHLLTGFSWYYLGHSQYRWLELIQISDLVGAYGVSLIVAASSAGIAVLIPFAWLQKLRLVPANEQTTTVPPPWFRRPAWQVGMVAAAFFGTLGYGVVRRHQADFQPGPRVALIQGNFVASLRTNHDESGKVYLTHTRLTGLAVREQPDIIIWPETMFRWPLFEAPASLTDEQLQDLAPQVPPELWRDDTVRRTLVGDAQKAGAAMIIGLQAVALEKSRVEQLNSAVLIRPDTGIAGRYDKMHLVPFGEYLPLQDTVPWLQHLTPYPPDFGLHAGTQAAVFKYRDWRLAPVICFEDTVPHLVRGIISAGSNGDRGEQIDVLVNLTNDGWFHGSSELDQHLITAAFRAVECRTPVARAVNTGISAIIDGDGAILEPDVFIDGDKKGRTTSRDPKTGRWHKELDAALVHTVPLDNRRSLYVRYGDWFATLCGMCVVLAAMGGIAPWFLRRKAV